jgi:hypothetical protein
VEEDAGEGRGLGVVWCRSLIVECVFGQAGSRS